MSTTFESRDDGVAPTTPSVALADEASLHRTFLAEYSELTAEARADLGDDALALAPKVVEGAFVRAWDARARFKTPAEVHQFLVEDVHHASARALSRRMAAHRMAGSGHADAHATAETTPDQAWQHILHALHGEAHSPQALANAAAASRHGAAEHINVITKERSPWFAVVGGVAVIALLTVAGMWMTRMSAGARFTNALNAPDAQAVTSTSARIGLITLDDGSKVRFAPESKLTIPKKFGPELRAVRLEGSAVFDVKQGLPEPFNVYAGDVAIVAKGTSFLVRAYPGDSAVVVVVQEGTVSVGHGKNMVDVGAGQALTIGKGDGRAATTAERESADAWRTGMLAVNNERLGDVVPLLTRWYGLHIAVQPQSLMDKRATFRASLDSTRQALRGIEQSAGVEFGYVGQNMVFHEPTGGAQQAGKPMPTKKK